VPKHGAVGICRKWCIAGCICSKNNEELRLDTTYYNLVIRYNLKKTPDYMFRPSLGHPQANTNIIKYRSVLHGIPFRLHFTPFNVPLPINVNEMEFHGVHFLLTPWSRDLLEKLTGCS
jgi:hypothetical protein